MEPIHYRIQKVSYTTMDLTYQHLPQSLKQCAITNTTLLMTPAVTLHPHRTNALFYSKNLFYSDGPHSPPTSKPHTVNTELHTIPHNESVVSGHLTSLIKTIFRLLLCTILQEHRVAFLLFFFLISHELPPWM